MTQRISREQVLAYRIAEQGLRREKTSLRQLDILQLGVQNTPPGSARLACAARLPTLQDDLRGLRFAWSYRISPHLHHEAALPGLAAALWPSARLAATGRPAMAVIEQATDAMARVVTRPMTKGAVSTAVTELVDEPLTGWCKACQSQHIYESLFRLAALPAGVWLDTESSPMLLTPTPNWPPLRERGTGLADLARTYLRFLGPATVRDVADFLSANTAELAAHWPDDLVDIDVDGRVGAFPADRLAALRTPSQPPRLRLLPPGDPYLQARDRTLILPDTTAHKTLWRVLGNPGALLVDGDIIGAWRAKMLGRRRLELSIEYVQHLPPDLAAELESEANRLAVARGADEVVIR